MNKSAPHLGLIKYSLPVMFGYLPLGTAYGFLMSNAGFGWELSLLFSVMTYAGALQFFAVPLFVSGASYMEVAMAALMINFRHVFYGISVLHLLPKSTWQSWLFMHELTDETYSLLTSETLSKTQAKWLSRLNHAYWVFGTFLGIAVASQVRPTKGIDFVLAVLFLVLCTEQIRRNQIAHLPLLALCACLVNSVLFPEHFLIATSLSCMAILYVMFKLRGES